MTVIAIGALAITLIATARLFVWPASAAVDHVDAIVVLGGGEPVRLETGLDLFTDGAGDVLVLSAGTAEEAATHGLDCDDSTVVCVDPTPATTAGEAHTISAIAAERGWSSLAVVTSTYHLTRARVLFGQCFDGHLAMVEAPNRRDRIGFIRDALREVPDLVAGVTFDRACWAHSLPRKTRGGRVALCDDPLTGESPRTSGAGEDAQVGPRPSVVDFRTSPVVHPGFERVLLGC